MPEETVGRHPCKRAGGQAWTVLESCEHDLNEAQTEIGFQGNLYRYPNHLLLSLFFGMALLGPNDNGFSHDSTSGQHIVMTSRWLVFCRFPSLDVMMNPSRHFFWIPASPKKCLNSLFFVGDLRILRMSYPWLEGSSC